MQKMSGTYKGTLFTVERNDLSQPKGNDIDNDQTDQVVDRLRLMQPRCLYIMNGDIVQTALLLTEISNCLSVYILIISALCKPKAGQPPRSVSAIRKQTFAVEC